MISLFASGIAAQKVSVFAPDKLAQETEFAGNLSGKLSERLKIVDSSLSETVFFGAKFENNFNLSLDESKNVGAAIGCDFFVLIKSESLRRESLRQPNYYESYAAIYLVSSRTGRLVSFELKSFQSVQPEKSKKLLFDSISSLSAEIYDKMKATVKAEISEVPASRLEEIPAENSSESKNFRSPIPYKRIKPEYPQTAYFYDVRATIDVTADIGADGSVWRTETSRWAGFGLDESVIATIRKMNWRPAERDGKTLPMRVLLRYNFKKIEK